MYFYTGQHVDLARIKNETKHVIVTAQHMDGLVPGRGMGHILPEALKAAGVEAVFESRRTPIDGQPAGAGHIAGG